jgi:hypothetical protein
LPSSSSSSSELSDAFSETLGLMAGTLSTIQEQKLSIRTFDSILDRFINDEEKIKGEEEEQEEVSEQIDIQSEKTSSIVPLVPKMGVPRQIYAIDSSSIVLGQASNGVLFSVRVVVISWNPVKGKRTIVKRFEVPGFLSSSNCQAIYTTLRQKLWGVSEDAKAPDPLKMVDRVRNLFERYTQIEVSKSTKDSIILIDGSLTGGTVDTPTSVLEEVLHRAQGNNCDVVAFSKKTRLTTMSGTKILDLPNEYVEIPCIIPISGLISPRSPHRLLGEVYVARLSRIPLSFRIDVSSSRDHSLVFGDLISSTPLESGYPVPLIHAHVDCYYNPFDILGVRAYLAKKRVQVTEEFDIRKILFGVYGGIS